MSTEREGMVAPKSIRATGMSHTLHPSNLSQRTRKVAGYPSARAAQAWPSSCTAMTSISTARLLRISAIKAALPDRPSPTPFESDEEGPPRRTHSGVSINKEAQQCCTSDST
jgi:hypothetical protein